VDEGPDEASEEAEEEAVPRVPPVPVEAGHHWAPGAPEAQLPNQAPENMAWQNGDPDARQDGPLVAWHLPFHSAHVQDWAMHLVKVAWDREMARKCGRATAVDPHLPNQLVRLDPEPLPLRGNAPRWVSSHPHYKEQSYRMFCQLPEEAQRALCWNLESLMHRTVQLPAADVDGVVERRLRSEHWSGTIVLASCEHPRHELPRSPHPASSCNGIHAACTVSVTSGSLTSYQ
jgi:hypothetical protein